MELIEQTSFAEGERDLPKDLFSSMTDFRDVVSVLPCSPTT